MPFLTYDPTQSYLLPPSVHDVLGENHLCFQVERIVKKLDLSALEQEGSVEGRPAYHPAMMISLWLYAYLLRVHSTRRLEQKTREDLGFRYLAGGSEPDHKTLSEFLRRHPRTLNDLFTQVLEVARSMGLVKLGLVAVDSTVIAANASRYRMDTRKRLRRQRLRMRKQIREWQKKTVEQDDRDDATKMKDEEIAKLQAGLDEMPRRLEKLKKSGQKQVSRTDPEARWLRDGKRGWTCGYRSQITVSQDHFIVAQRTTREAADNHSLLPMVEQTISNCCDIPGKTLADAGFFSLKQIGEVEKNGSEAYVPDNNLAREMHGGKRAPAGIGSSPLRDPLHRRMREKLRSEAGRECYEKRQGTVEPVFGVIKQQLGLRRFRRRGLEAATVEFALAAMAYNINRILKEGGV